MVVSDLGVGDVMDKLRLRYAHDFKWYFWTWDVPLGYTSLYYDGWNNQINLGLVCLCWMTPPLMSDR